MEIKPNHCPICHKGNIVSRTHPSFHNLLWKCENCGLIFAWPQPEVGKLKDIYSTSYFKSDDSQNCGYDDYGSDKCNIMRTARKRLKAIESMKPDKGKLLDVGCAFGFFVESALGRGWDAYGIDISEDAIAVARENLKARVRSGTIHDVLFEPETFDVITMWDVIEHVPNPRIVVAACRSLLKPGGLLVIATPDSGSVVAKIAGNKWMGFKDHEHLFYFSRRALRNILHKQRFTIRKMYFTGKYVTLDLFVRRLSLYIPLVASMFRNVVRWSRIPNFSLYVNPFDIVAVYAKKK